MVRTTGNVCAISNEVAVIQWIVLCRKNGMTAHVIIFWLIHVMSLAMTVSGMCFLM